MTNYNYENHVMPNPLLPFIFHRDSVSDQPFGGVPNWHENIEVLCCYEGSGSVHCGPEETPFCQGDIFVVNANVPHTFCSNSRLSYFCLIIDNSFCEANGIPISTLHFQKLIQCSDLVAAYRQVVSSYDRFRSDNICATADIRYAVLGLLRLLCANHTVQEEAISRTVSSERVKKAIAYVRRHMAESISLDDISTHVGISKYHLSREFKAFTGMTVIDTVNLIRCTEARRQIESGISVSSAAISCGFENLSYFTRTFKKHFNILPSALLRK